MRHQLFESAKLPEDCDEFSDDVVVSALKHLEKASKLLTTPNMIAVAPGLDLKSNTVISTSGNHPHLVMAKNRAVCM